MSVPAPPGLEPERPTARRDLLEASLGIAVFLIGGPLVLGLVVLVGIVAANLAGDAVDSLAEGRRFDPAASVTVAIGLTLVVLRFGWTAVWGMLIGPSAVSGTIIALRRLVTGGASLRFALLTGLVVGIAADIVVVGYGIRFVGATRIGIFAGWVVIGSLVATLACWRAAAAGRRYIDRGA
ncbi:hypothetical protein OSH08_18105 [Kaistia geumhonensis]|uniref:DUF308 domain-containing protein n=1 Tax=Kaistia geumhonensis TaxID=410839 RepID=A0ABU0MAH5_9HYPH|nr:hypothetical protein [Kaistia geumhonensis]MCX5480919.1 hypothetical protein [Kaistia geumhonensis]MDQ0517976.1 hypothetical protein [Kaistia geumhonensis]